MAFLIFKKLSLEVKLPGIGNFLDRIVSRFDDNAALVRKNAVQCFVALLNQSPLLAPLQKIDELRKGVEALGEAFRGRVGQGLPVRV